MTEFRSKSHICKFSYTAVQVICHLLVQAIIFLRINLRDCYVAVFAIQETDFSC